MKKSFGGLELDLGDEPFADDMPSGADVSMVRIAAQALAGGGTLIDVGAHVGTICLPVARVCPAARILAFEPLDRNRALLHENASRHGLSNVGIRGNAIGDRTGLATFLPAGSNSQDGRLAAPEGAPRAVFGEERRAGELVAISRLDEELPGDLPRPVVLKIDAQGAEAAVLRGARGIDIDILLVEVWPYGLLRQGDSFESFDRELARFSHGSLLNHWLAQPFEGGHRAFVRVLPWDAAAKGEYTDYVDVACCNPRRASEDR